jgi:hypothetical protein
MRDPAGGVAQALRDEPAAANAALLFGLDQARPFEHAQVLHHAGKRNVEGAREFAERALARREAREHRPAQRVGERRKGRIEPRRRIVNHQVYYLTPPRACQEESADRPRLSAPSRSPARP